MINKKLNSAVGALLGVVAAIFLVIAGLLIYSSYGFLKGGISTIWYASIITVLLGWLVAYLAKILIVVLIAGSFIVFGIYLAMCILTFMFAAKTNEKTVKGLLIGLIIVNAVVIFNLVDIIKGFFMSLNGASNIFSAADFAVFALVAVAAVAAIVCVILCIINLATARKPAAADGSNLNDFNKNDDGENL